MAYSTRELSKLLSASNRSGYNLKAIGIRNAQGQVLGCAGDIHKPYNVHSCAKTVTSLAIGICETAGLLSLDDYMISFFPEYEGLFSAGTDQIKIVHLLQMTSGKCLRSLLDTPKNKKWALDWLLWFFEESVSKVTGQEFYYSAHSYYILGRIIERICSMKLSDFLAFIFWHELTEDEPIWGTCPLGHTICAGNLYLSCDQLSKIGLLLLNYGHINNKQIVGSTYIYNMLNSFVPSNDPFFEDVECYQGYGYGIWKCSIPETFRIWGAGGSFCTINYKKQICITTIGERQNLWKEHNENEILRDIHYKLLRVVQ